MMDLPKRKHPRLKNYDYGSSGYYYVTINTQDNLPVLSRVGRGLAPAETKIHLLPIGEAAKEQLFELEKRYPFVRIDKYVIMPTHIHAIIVLFEDASSDENKAAGASPRPTLTDIICAFKSLTTRIANKNDGVQGRKIFQTSFYEKVLRNEESYLEAWQYIDENPLKYTLKKTKSL